MAFLCFGDILATGATADTGTDNEQYLTSKTANDAHNIPSVVPSTSGNVLTSDGTDWTSAGARKSTVTTKASVTQTSGTSSTYFDVTNSSLSVTISKTANVLVNVQIRIQNNTNTSAIAVRLLRDSTVVVEQIDCLFILAGYSQEIDISKVEANVAAGTYTYKLQMKSINNSTTVYVVASTNYSVTELA